MPSMPRTLILFVSCLLYTPLTICTSTTSTTPTVSLLHYHHYRRILHQPLLPFGHPFTLAPSLTPQPQPQPQPQQLIPDKYPFSSQSPPNNSPPPFSFFPFYPSPPPPPLPPSSTALSTFPANISSLVLPQSPSSSKPISRKLIAVVVSISLLSAALIASVAAFVFHHRHHHFYSNKDPSRTDSLRLYPPNTATSDGGNHKPPPPPPAPPLRNVSSTSSEFLYLGTLVSSMDATDKNDSKDSFNCNAANISEISGVCQRLGSPEIHPLPPLPRYHHHFQHSHQIATDSDDQQDEEFFSPKGSTSDSPNRAGTSHNRAFEAVDFGTRSSNSRNNLYPSSNSASSTHSGSPTIPLNFSPGSVMSKSPDSVVNFPAPPRPIPPPPPREPRHLCTAPPLERDSGDTQNSPARVSDVFGPNQLSPPRKLSVPVVKLPPPPPPPPPPMLLLRFWENSVGPTQLGYPITGPPELVAPSRRSSCCGAEHRIYREK